MANITFNTAIFQLRKYNLYTKLHSPILV